MNLYRNLVDRVMPYSIRPYLVANCIIVLAIGLVIGLAYGLHVIGWLWVTLVSLVAVYLCRRVLKRQRRRSSAQSFTDEPDDTREIPVYVTPKEARQVKPRQLKVDDEGRDVYEVVERTKVKRHFWSKGKVRLQQPRQLLLDKNDLVHSHLIRKSGFVPSDGEHVVKVFDRLHWWEHGPAQIGAVLIGVISSLTAAYALGVITDAVYAVVSIILWVLLLVASLAIYVSAWLPWAYTFLVITNLRLILIYRPPFGLAGDFKQAEVRFFLTVEIVDQKSTSRLLSSKWIPALGNLLPKVGITGFKIFKANTAAEDDKWIKDGIRGVRHAEEVEKIVLSIKNEAAQLKEKRHEEDMDLQRAQVRVAEETRDIMRDFVTSAHGQKPADNEKHE